MPKDNEEYTEIEDRGDQFVPDDEDEHEEEVLEEDEEDSDEEVEDEEDVEEDEEDSESEGDENEDEEEDEDDQEEPRIPRSRLNQVIEQRESEKERADAAQDRIEQLEDQMLQLIELQKANLQSQAPKPEPKPKFNFKAKFKEANEALLEGDLEKNSDIMLEIEEARAEELRATVENARDSATREAKTEASASLEEARFERVIQQAEETHSFLDADSEDYNEKAVRMVNAILTGHLAQGEPKSKALKLALEDVVPMFESEKPQKQREQLGTKRTKQARKKAVKAQQQQPPTPTRSAKGKKARDLDQLDLAKMSDAEYSKLTMREKKALRGD